MRVNILGSAAGGAFPQWNCSCPNCRALRAGTLQGKARNQTQVAISADGVAWFLLGASPDLRSQIEATPELQPHDKSSDTAIRKSPIAGAILANADVDHVLGLLLLRELQPLNVYTTASIRRILCDDNSMFGMLQRVENQVSWTDVNPGEWFPLRGPSGDHCSLRCRALSLGEHFPAYVSARRQTLVAGESSLGLVIESSSRKRVVFMPAVPGIDDALLEEVDAADLLLMDGTFWSDDELIRIYGRHVAQKPPTARQMGHIPISSAEGSLSKLAGLRRPRKIYLHINNTNPVLNEAGPEYREVREAGWEIAEDGWQFDL